jgi:hypothetical protein
MVPTGALIDLKDQVMHCSPSGKNIILLRTSGQCMARA